MKIRRLELFGFKSFKDKTVLSFDQPITAIVGSNGCGKSNVVDALYWVMGDMSPKHLRGHSMVDVIFSGSRDSAPMDMAEVTLVLERDPATDPELPPQYQSSAEIQITRRYYRSGESEYFMNKTSCRLRDIQEFFMDTGVGAKAYSIIEQGAISRLVTQKPEDRRLVIEEVAGIMKFKARKAETERKIENSRANLTRVDDLVKDLQKQLGTLKRQADKAEKFKSYSEELRGLEVQMGCREWLERSELRQAALLESGELAELRQKAEVELSELKARSEELASRLLTLEDEWTTARGVTREKELALKDLETKLATSTTRKESLEHRVATDEEALQTLETRRVELEKDLEALDQDIRASETVAFELATALEEATVAVSSSRTRSESVRERVETVRRELHTEELEQTRLTQQIQGLQRNISQAQNREQTLETQVESLSSELALREEERNGTLHHLEVAFSTRTDLEQEKNVVDADLSRFESERSELQARRDSAREDLTVARVRKEQLEALDRDLAGVDATSRTLARHLRSLGREESLLADLVKVPTLLEKAVEAALGKNLQRIVARDLGEAEGLRKVLRESTDDEARKGRSAVWLPELTEAFARTQSLPDLASLYCAADAPADASMAMATEQEIPSGDGMTSVETVVTTPPRTIQAMLLEHERVVGPLVDLVKTESPVAPWLDLLQGIWVVRDLETLQDLANRLKGVPLSFVTLAGDYLSRDGFLDLAPCDLEKAQESVGLIQRKREILELRTEATRLDAALAEAQSALDNCLFSIDRAKEKFRELTARLSSLNPDVDRHTTLLRQVEAQIARLLEKRLLLGEEREKLAIEKKELGERVEEHAEKLNAAEMRKQNVEASLEEAKAELQSLLNLLREAEAKHQELSAEARRRDQALSELRSKRAAAEQEKTLSQARRQHLENGLAQLREDIARIATDLETFAVEADTRRQAFEEATDVERRATSEVENQKLLITETQKAGEKLATEFQALVDRIRYLDQRLAVNDVEARNLKDRIRDQYQLTLEDMEEGRIRELATPSDIEVMADPESAKTRVQALRTKIENLGKINMVAVEEFDELSKRHEYLFIQRQDLADAISQLVDAIERIDRESRHRFADAFTAVNDAFTKTFPVLFGGGQAELRLTDPNNMLETGVEIVAQPPGKKLQSVTLLSGGEKALTAVSLIFGIFSIKPSPFCVLDEVDAPLDDSNVARFNTQVRNMAKTSQIIMITHHKASMESCDGLFGVTMEQPGISKIASAKIGELS